MSDSSSTSTDFSRGRADAPSIPPLSYYTPYHGERSTVDHLPSVLEEFKVPAGKAQMIDGPKTQNFLTSAAGAGEAGVAAQVPVPPHTDPTLNEAFQVFRQFKMNVQERGWGTNYFLSDTRRDI
jgi:hypothetical protein